MIISWMILSCMKTPDSYISINIYIGIYICIYVYMYIYIYIFNSVCLIIVND